MSSSAVAMMVITQVIVASITIYFFWKVLKTPSKPEPDSFSENDNDPR